MIVRLHSKVFNLNWSIVLKRHHNWTLSHNEGPKEAHIFWREMTRDQLGSLLIYPYPFLYPLYKYRVILHGVFADSLDELE